MIPKKVAIPIGVGFLSVLFVFITLSMVFPTDADPAWRSNPLAGTLIALKAIVGFLVLPLLVIRFLFNEPPRNFGWRYPDDPGKALAFSAAIVIITLPFLVLFSGRAEFYEYYRPGGPFAWVAIAGPILSLLYYLAEEFLFRGFLLFGVARGIGYHSVWVTNLFFAFLHVPKPGPEIWFSFGLGVALALLALKTKSFFPAALTHFTISTVLNLLMVV